jgi:hypothetical protein
MENWQLFDDSRFGLQFRYPTLASDGEPVDRVETEADGILRDHILVPQGREVYFEVTKYSGLSAAAEYGGHKASLPKQFDPLSITELNETDCASLPAYEYTFKWNQGRRRVLLVERSVATYPILYNPPFAVNLQILSTIEWLSPP